MVNFRHRLHHFPHGDVALLGFRPDAGRQGVGLRRVVGVVLGLRPDLHHGAGNLLDCRRLLGGPGGNGAAEFRHVQGGGGNAFGGFVHGGSEPEFPRFSQGVGAEVGSLGGQEQGMERHPAPARPFGEERGRKQEIRPHVMAQRYDQRDQHRPEIPVQPQESQREKLVEMDFSEASRQKNHHRRQCHQRNRNEVANHGASRPQPKEERGEECDTAPDRHGLPPEDLSEGQGQQRKNRHVQPDHGYQQPVHPLRLFLPVVALPESASAFHRFLQVHGLTPVLAGVCRGFSFSG